MKESDFWRKIKAGIKTPGLDAVRIESGLTHRGIADVNIAYDGREVWLELKILKRGLRPKLSMSQVIWHERRAEIRCKTWIAVLVLTGVARIALYRGCVARQLADRGIIIPPHAEFEHPYNWQAFRETLFS